VQVLVQDLVLTRGAHTPLVECIARDVGVERRGRENQFGMAMASRDGMALGEDAPARVEMEIVLPVSRWR